MCEEIENTSDCDEDEFAAYLQSKHNALMVDEDYGWWVMDDG